MKEKRISIQKNLEKNGTKQNYFQATIRTFCELAFKELNIIINWSGSGINEVGIDSSNGNEIISVDPNYFRPTEVDHLIGDASKAKELLNWSPKYDLSSLVKEMINSDLEIIKKSIQFL